MNQSDEDTPSCDGISCGCMWLTVSDAVPLLQSVWPDDIKHSGRWAVCLKNPHYMHVKYTTFDRTMDPSSVNKALYFRYIYHHTGQCITGLIQSEICHRCGDIQNRKIFQILDPSIVPFKFTACPDHRRR